MTDYFLPADYKANSPLRDAGGPYWTPKRIRMSSYFQYHVYKQARKIADDHGLKRVADIGCGPATKLMHLFDERFELFGFDQPEAVEICRSRYDRGIFEVLDLDVEEMTVDDDAKYDLIVCADVIEHLEYPERLLRRIRQMSGAETRILISTPDRFRLHGSDVRSPSNPAHIREWTADEFQEFASANGLTVAQKHFFPLMRLPLSLDGLWQWCHSAFGPSDPTPNMAFLCTVK